MKKIVIILIIYFSLILSTNAELGFCDNANINNNKVLFNDICNNWNKVDDFTKINSFTWKYIDIKSGYFWNKNNINKIHKDYLINTWYFWNNNTDIKLQKYININLLWYFWNTNNLNNKIENDFILPIWYLWDYDYKILKNTFNDSSISNSFLKNINNNSLILKNFSSRHYTKKRVVYNNISYYELLDQLIIENTYLYKISISEHDYNIFKKNILEIIINWKNIIIPWKDVKLLKLKILESNFLKNVRILFKNAWELNNAIKKVKNDNEKVYILKYYLN